MGEIISIKVDDALPLLFEVWWLVDVMCPTAM